MCREQSSEEYMSRTIEFVATTLANLSLTTSPYISYMIFDTKMSNSHFMEVLPQAWGNSLVLIRLRFKNDSLACRFKYSFNQTVKLNREVFAALTQICPPFAHRDQTRPERELRLVLQNFCVQKNTSERGNFEIRGGDGADTFEHVTRVHYFHNGVQLFKVLLLIYFSKLKIKFFF